MPCCAHYGYSLRFYTADCIPAFFLFATSEELTKNRIGYKKSFVCNIVPQTYSPKWLKPNLKRKAKRL